MPIDGQGSAGRLLLIIGVTAVAATLCSLVWLHPIAWDEIEFFRATDWVARGGVPYRDFWEHHTPLQWFLFAPVAALVRSPGADAIVAMRWAQTPLWVATFCSLALWMRGAGVNRWPRRIAIILALCSSVLMLSGIEYRVDVLGTLLFLLGLVLLQRSDRGTRYAFAAGVAFCLAGLANLRLGPLLAVTVLLARIVRLRERRLEGNPRINATYAAVIATFALAAVYFVATHSARVAFHDVWIENYLADRYSKPVAWISVNRFAVPFGLRPIELGGAFDPAAVDPAGVAILVVGSIGVIRALWKNHREPDAWFVLAFLQVTNILFIVAMKVSYMYHLEIVFLMMIPFVAREVDLYAGDRRSRQVAVTSFVVLALIVHVGTSLLRGKEADREYQDVVMREVDRRTSPNAKVFDGVGWALRRQPSYKYWFLPGLVKRLEPEHRIEPYGAAQMIADPPDAIIMDYRVVTWIATHPDLQQYVLRNYVPAWANLWIPGLNARLVPQRPAVDWIVPADGVYRIYSSRGLATHVWFTQPLLAIYTGPGAPQSVITLARFPPAQSLSWTVGNEPITPVNGMLPLRRRQHVRVVSADTQPRGVLVVPAYETHLFRQPADHGSLDAADAPVTHVPDFRKLIAAFGF